MSQRTQIILVDDYDGSEGDVETVAISLTGLDAASGSYQIDLSAEHRAELIELLLPVLQHARPVKRRRTRKAK